MRTRVCIILTCIGMMTPEKSWTSDLRIDFRRMSFDNDALRLVGREAEQLIIPTERGLLIRLPPNEGIVGPMGLAPRRMIRGDFEIVAEFELLRYDRPREGPGVGIAMEVEFPTAPIGSITLGRLASPAEGDRFTWAASPFAGGNMGRGPSQLPARSRSGKLRLVRTGATVRADCADGDGTFVLLSKQEVGDADARMIWLGVQTGSRPCRAEALLKSLTISAKEWVEPPETRASESSGIDPLFLFIITFDVVLLALATWKLCPARSRKPVKRRAC